MLTLVLPFSMDSLQSAIRRYLARPHASIESVVTEKLEDEFPGGRVCYLNVRYRVTPEPETSSTLSLLLRKTSHESGLPSRKVLSSDDISGEPTAPLVVTGAGVPGTGGYLEPERYDSGDWILVEGAGCEPALIEPCPTAEGYRRSLGVLAARHAAWWAAPPAEADRPWSLGSPAATRLIREARASLMEIESSRWGERFLAKGQARAWLAALDDPAPLFNVLADMPHTLLDGGLHGYAPSGLAHQPVTTAGPAPVDLACLYSAARWQNGRAAMSLPEMRTYYLRELNAHLSAPVDRYLFDAGVDAARAWHFVTTWPPLIVEQRPYLQACLHHLRVTVIEPSFACLHRCLD